MPRVIISSAADADLFNIAFYIGQEDKSPGGAIRVLQAVEKASALYAR